MKAVVFDGKELKLEEVEKPVPKANEVLVRIAACGVCHTDLHVVQGEVAFPTPAVLGHEISGTVEEVGEGIESFKKGDRVVAPFIMPCGSCRFCRMGLDDMCENFFKLNRLQGKLYDGNTRLFRKDGSPVWMYSMGGLAEFAVVPVTSVFKLPDSLELQTSCILGCAAFTAYGAVVNQASLKEGENAAVIAVGGVGLNILQISKYYGASKIIAVDVNEDKLAKAKELGATHILNSRSSNVVEEIMEITEGFGVDVAFEALGRPETIQYAFNSVRDGGRTVVVGIAGQKKTVEIDITRLVRRGIKVIGSYGARTRKDMPEVIKLAETGVLNLKGIVTKKFSLEEAAEAYSELKEGKIVGRAIVTAI
ncbi:MAG: zinc-binding dehydrogenase [Conexivisphaerales archaeon]